MSRYNGIPADPETEVVVSAGSTGALFCACYALLDPGDEVIVFEPYYGYHLNTLVAVDAVPVFVPMRPPHWQFDRGELLKAITPRTKAILINTPGNPTGKVYDRQELKAIAELAVRHDLFIFTDEIYEYFLYDGREHISIGSFPEDSKTFSITGWRVGYAVCERRLARMIGYVNDLVYVCAPAPLQVGVAKGIALLPGEFYRRLCLQYETKRDMMVSGLREGGLRPHVPQGAYYILADVSSVPGGNAKERALHILRECGVAGVPGSAFYHQGGEDTVRFCFAKRDDVLRTACDRLSLLRW